MSQREVVKLLKPDSLGHMQRLFSTYSWSSGTLEVLGMATFLRLVQDLVAAGAQSLPEDFDEQGIFCVRTLLMQCFKALRGDA